MQPFPEPPELPLSQRISGSIALRYEDVSQDGQLLPGAMPAALGAVFWGPSERPGGLSQQLRGSGVVPILSRLWCESLARPISVRHPLTAHCRHELAESRGSDGGVARLLLRLWLDLRAPRANTHAPQPDGAGEVIGAGRLFAEHVFTRPLAPAGERRVLAWPAEVQPASPPQPRPWLGPQALLAAAADEQPLTDGLERCGEILFGRGHTDANQHVNSLVYPRLFYDAALRVLAPWAKPQNLRLVTSELAFRKPCFVGDFMHIWLRAYQAGERLSVRGVVAAVELDVAAPERAHVFGRLVFERAD